MWTGLIASPDRLWFIDARALMRRLLGLEPGWCGDNTAVLLFNMIRDGARLPAARPGDYLELG